MSIHRSGIASILALGAIFAFAPAARAQSIESQGSDEIETRGDMPPDGRGNFIRGITRGGRASVGATPSSGNGINYHNGPVLHTVNLYYILYGNWTTQSSLNPSGTTLLTHWGATIGGSPYFNINTTYSDSTGSVPNVVTYKGAFTDSGSLGTSLTDASIGTLVGNAIKSNAWGTPGVADPNGLYLVLTAPGVAETSGFLTQYCGWHGWGSYGTTLVQYGFVGDAAGPRLGNCAAQSTSPNGDAGVDGMISVMAHELSETVSDPRGTAWYDASGEENGDKCAWNFGTVAKASNGANYNVTLNGANYLMQQIWLNSAGGKCALSFGNTPDFGVAVSGTQTVVAGTTSTAYALTATALNGFSLTGNPVAWTFGTLPAGITANPHTLASGASVTFTLTASGSAAPGTYAIPITGTSGSLAHSLSALLVVSPATFTLSVNPTSRTVTRPSTGSAIYTYAIAVNPVGAFTSPVTLSAAGSTTGVTANITSVNPVKPGASGTMSVTVTNSARSGARTLSVLGTATSANVASQQVAATLTVQ